MAADRHRRAADLFVAAAALPPAQRADFLAGECGGDAALRAEVESLLAHDPGEESERFGDGQLPSVGQLLTLAGAGAPTQIGPYHILGVLGRGGMGIVYRARQDNPAREVAVKVLAAGASSEGALKRFAREAAALGRLQHPGIAQIYQAGTADTGGGAQPYFAMELVDGVPITESAVQRGLDLPARLELLIQVCRALDHAHQRGVVHRDLKPANILVDQAGQPKVLDFGVARLLAEEGARTAERTAAGDVLGTIAYMSPEQAAGDHAAVDARTDVHALGVLAYELLCGESPRDLTGRSVAGMLAMVASEPPVPLARRNPALRGDLDTIVGKALATDPRRRYASAAELAADLRRYLDHQPITARPLSAWYRTRMLVRRHRGLAAGLLVAAVVLVVGTATSVLWALRAEENAQRAADNARRADRERGDAQQLSRFLTDLLQSAAPAVARGENITAKDLVLRGHDQALRDASHGAAGSHILALLGAVLRSMGDSGRAEGLLVRAVEELRRLGAEAGRDAELAHAVLVLGQLRYDQGQHDAARALMTEALELCTRWSGRGSADAAECLFSLGVLDSVQGRFDEALALEQEAANAFRTHLGPDSPRLAMALDGIGAVFNKREQPDAAAPMFEQAIAIFERNGEESLAMLASSLANLAIVRMNQGRPREAGPLFRRALDIGEKIYPKDHPALIVRLTNLATYFSAQGRPAQAQPLLERALRIHEQHQIGDRRATAHTWLTLGQTYEQLGQLEEASAPYEKSAAMFERLDGPDSLDRTAALESQGRLARKRRQPEAALKYYQAALRVRENALGRQHASLRGVLEGMADCHRDLGQGAESERVLERIEQLR